MTTFDHNQGFLRFTKDHAGILIVCGLFLIAGVLSLNRVLVYTPDSARYLAWSQSLGHFEGFRDNTTPEPSKFVVHAPLYSVLLAPTAWISTENVIPSKVITIFLGIALILTVYWWAKKRLGTSWAVLVGLLIAVNPAFFLYSTQVLSDVPFAVCVFLFFSITEREITVEKGEDSRLLALTAVVVCGLFMREVGLALVASATLVLLLKRYYKSALLILAVSAGFFALWYIRNDIIVAGIEHPSLQNTQLFFRHLFTPSDVSIVGEFLARLKTNAAIYGINVMQLPFVAETLLRGISTMAPSQFPISIVLEVMPYVYHALLILAAALVLVGVYAESGDRSRILVVAVFLAIYLVPILLYPINDARFMFPPLLLELYFIVAGFRFLVNRAAQYLRRPAFVPVFTTISFMVLLLPNFAWGITYVGNNWRYERSPLGFYNEMKSVQAYPALFARPIELAGNWIAEHTDSSAVVISRWKELGLFTHGRKVLDSDPQTRVDPFEDLLRDYHVKYIVTVISRGALREYEQIFAQASRYHFNLAYRYADLEIVKVEKGPANLNVGVTDRDSTEFGIQVRYARAIRELLQNKPLVCETMLKQLPLQTRTLYPVVLNLAVAKEFAGDLKVANTMFEQFHKIQQAGSIVQPAWYHLEIISRLRAAMNDPSGPQRAEELNAVAAYYWILGFRQESLLTMDKSIAADSVFFPSVIFRAVYSLLDGDTLRSAQFLKLARHIDPENELVQNLSKLLGNLKVLATQRDPNVDLALRLENVRLLRTMGLRENAIGEALSILADYPRDSQCLRLLVDLYYQKGRYAPALVYLKRLQSLHPSDDALRQELRNLENRW